ncbi:hypothetical protein PM082_000382 [Marasmius tenuissimus]|nr:hypothetical protein PM082_000382 [Marasmius tenuissimus]
MVLRLILPAMPRCRIVQVRTEQRVQYDAISFSPPVTAPTLPHRRSSSLLTVHQQTQIGYKNSPQLYNILGTVTP